MKHITATEYGSFQWCPNHDSDAHFDNVSDATRDYERKDLRVCPTAGLRTHGHDRSWRETVRNRVTICCDLNNGLRTKAVY